MLLQLLRDEVEEFVDWDMLEMVTAWTVLRVVQQEPLQDFLICIFFSLVVGILTSAEALFIQMHKLRGCIWKKSFSLCLCSRGRVVVFRYVLSLTSKWALMRESRINSRLGSYNWELAPHWVLLRPGCFTIHHFKINLLSSELFSLNRRGFGVLGH